MATKLSNEEILQMAIEKAQGNGWKSYYAEYASNEPNDKVNRIPISGFIFSHSFAKAFWGEELEPDYSRDGVMTDSWRIHLEEMVLEDDPLQYLAKFL